MAFIAILRHLYNSFKFLTPLGYQAFPFVSLITEYCISLTMSLEPVDGPLGIKRAAHLLRRLCFGATAEQIESLAPLTIAQAMEQLFPELPETTLPIDPATNETWIGMPAVEDVSSGDSDLQEFFKGWWLGQMLSAGAATEHHLGVASREKIVFFLHTLFTTQQEKVSNSRGLYYQNALFRTFARDDRDEPEYNLKELTVRICIDNAMLRFLDGQLNVDGNPNENYARELLELFSIGRGLEGNLPTGLPDGDYGTFTEQDVQAGARVLSGWEIDGSFQTLDELTQIPVGRVRGGTIAERHDNGSKQFSARLGNGVVTPDPLLLDAGRPTAASARDEIRQMIDLIYDQEETARHICRRLYRFYVHHDIPVTLDDDLIATLAQVFIDGGYKLEPVVKVLVSSQHFFGAENGVDDDQVGSIIKSPLDLVIGSLRSFGLSFPDPWQESTRFYTFAGRLLRQMDLMGMNLLNPFEVAGYPAYHQFPLYHRNWISTNYLTQRYNFIRGLVATPNDIMEMPDDEYDGTEMVNILEYVRNTVISATAQDPHQLIIALASRFLPNAENLTFDEDPAAELTSARLNYFLNAFLYSPQIDADPESAWTFRWLNGVDDEVVANQLQNLMNAMLQTPEYQLK